MWKLTGLRCAVGAWLVVACQHCFVMDASWCAAAAAGPRKRKRKPSAVPSDISDASDITDTSDDEAEPTPGQRRSIRSRAAAAAALAGLPPTIAQQQQQQQQQQMAHTEQPVRQPLAAEPQLGSEGLCLQQQAMPSPQQHLP